MKNEQKTKKKKYFKAHHKQTKHVQNVHCTSRAINAYLQYLQGSKAYFFAAVTRRG